MKIIDSKFHKKSIKEGKNDEQSVNYQSFKHNRPEQN
jgi:hypothetical protein